MSIEAAAKELTKEIEHLLKEAERLTKLRDSLVPAASVSTSSALRPASKKVAAKKASGGKSAPAKKRVLSAKGRQNIVKALKRRWAEKRKAEAAAKKSASGAAKKAASAEK